MDASTMTPDKPTIAFYIERYGDTAVVTIFKYWFEGDKHTVIDLEKYETMSKGAAASARKSMKKFHTKPVFSK